MLRELGASVLDADQLAREVVEPGAPALQEIAARFPGVVTPEGRLDRAALGAKVFGNEAERAALNAIIHPRIQQAFLEKTEALAAQGVELVVYDAPLLYENRLDQRMEQVIVVAVPYEVQRARLIARDGFTPDQADARLASQLPLGEKRAKADHVIDNSGTREQTRAQVEQVWKSIRDAAP